MKSHAQVSRPEGGFDLQENIRSAQAFGYEPFECAVALAHTVSYSNNINAGTAKATITGKGNYSGTVEKTFTITKTTSRTNKQSLPKIVFAEIAGC